MKKAVIQLLIGFIPYILLGAGIWKINKPATFITLGALLWIDIFIWGRGAKK